jgi:hypothetical protein
MEDAGPHSPAHFPAAPYAWEILHKFEAIVACLCVAHNPSISRMNKG